MGAKATTLSNWDLYLMSKRLVYSGAKLLDQYIESTKLSMQSIDKIDLTRYLFEIRMVHV